MFQMIVVGIVITVVGLFALAAVDRSIHSDPSTDTPTSLVEREGEEDAKKAKVAVSGEVSHPGDYYIETTATLADLLTMAGGVTSKADSTAYDPSLVIGARTSFYVPPATEKEKTCLEETIQKVNINTATSSELTGVGFNASQATNLISYRKQNGSFLALEDILQVPGIGEGTFQKVKNKICLR